MNLNTFRLSILAGIAVGIAGWGYLAYNNIIGGVLFSFGLLTVVGYKLPLYTGTAGFVALRDEEGHSCWFRAIRQLTIILLGNITGCLLVSLLSRLSPIETLSSTAQNILESRLSIGPLRAGLLAIGCGFIMTTVVTFARHASPALRCTPLHQLRFSPLPCRCILLSYCAHELYPRSPGRSAHTLPLLGDRKLYRLQPLSFHCSQTAIKSRSSPLMERDRHPLRERGYRNSTATTHLPHHRPHKQTPSHRAEYG